MAQVTSLNDAKNRDIDLRKEEVNKRIKESRYNEGVNVNDKR